MTHEERVLAAINLEPYDRVPVAPFFLNTEFAFHHKGRDAADAYNPVMADEGFQAVLDLFDEVGGWDAACLAGMFAIAPGNALYTGNFRYPGYDDGFSRDTTHQYEEHEVLKAEDYDQIIDLGWRAFIQKNIERFKRSMSVRSPLRRPDLAMVATNRYMQLRDTWYDRDVPVLAGTMLLDPQMTLSILRTLPQFTLDLYRRPDKVEAALEAMVDDFIKDAMDAMLLTGAVPSSGIPGINLACERGSGAYYNLDIFERFVWPYIKKAAETWTGAGYITTLHFDTDWTRNLPYLLELPKKKCICELDSTTDIFKAKEILKDHMCIMGDVPPQLSSHGTPEEMEAYCQKLIDVVGKDTGLILSNGCGVPPDTKFENFKMMIDTAKNYPPSRPKTGN